MLRGDDDFTRGMVLVRIFSRGDGIPHQHELWKWVPDGNVLNCCPSSPKQPGLLKVHKPQEEKTQYLIAGTYLLWETHEHVTHMKEHLSSSIHPAQHDVSTLHAAVWREAQTHVTRGTHLLMGYIIVFSGTYIYQEIIIEKSLLLFLHGSFQWFPGSSPEFQTLCLPPWVSTASQSCLAGPAQLCAWNWRLAETLVAAWGSGQ